MNSSLVRTSLVAAGCFASFAFVAACTASTPESDQPEAKTDVGSSESALGGGKKVGSKGCPIAIRCAPGYIGVDTDGDGCLDTCEPKVCDIAIRCAPGYIGVDSDGDGCLDTCQPEKK